MSPARALDHCAGCRQSGTQGQSGLVDGVICQRYCGVRAAFRWGLYVLGRLITRASEIEPEIADSVVIGLR